MRLTLLASAGLVGCLIAQPASAQPITYPGGVNIMSMIEAESIIFQADYTITPRLAIGTYTKYARDEEWYLQGIQLTHLVHRWNMPDSQANLYARFGVGGAKGERHHGKNMVEPAAFGGISADWEDRRYYVSYENHITHAGEIDKSFHQRARVGIAPYVGGYGDLHTWLMLQVDHTPNDRDGDIALTPLVRLFQGTILGELGVSTNGEVMAHITATF